MKFLMKRTNSNPSLKFSFDEFIERGFIKEYLSINGEEEIIFTLGSNRIEIFHHYGKKKVFIDVVVTANGSRKNLGDVLFGYKKGFDSIEETFEHINTYLKRYIGDAL